MVGADRSQAAPCRQDSRPAVNSGSSLVGRRRQASSGRWWRHLSVSVVAGAPAPGAYRRPRAMNTLARVGRPSSPGSWLRGIPLVSPISWPSSPVQIDSRICGIASRTGSVTSMPTEHPHPESDVGNPSRCPPGPGLRGILQPPWRQLMAPASPEWRVCRTNTPRPWPGSGSCCRSHLVQTPIRTYLCPTTWSSHSPVSSDLHFRAQNARSLDGP